MYQPFDQFLLRTPLYPFNELENILHDDDAFLKRLTDEQFQEAVFIASPTLYKELRQGLGDRLTDIRKKEHLFSSLQRYLSRMSTRCTPFGLFAGCAMGIVSEETCIISDNRIHKQTRMDMYYLCSLAQYLSQLPQIRSWMKYYPTTSVKSI